MKPSPPSPTRFRLGIVTGLQDEARIVRTALAAPRPGSGVTDTALDSAMVACLGPGSGRAGQAAVQLLAGGARALLSFGVAGGCDPALPAGTIVLATGVRDLTGIDGAGPARGELIWTNREWRRRLQALLLGTALVEEAAVATVSAPLAGAGAKEALFWSDGVAAVDMESAAVGRAAIGAGVPFMALRAIVDAAELTLPPAALAGLGPDGAQRPAAVAAAALRRPQDIPGLLRVAAAHRRAMAALLRAAVAAAPLFGAV